MARKMKDPVAKYFGTPEEIAELKAKHLRGECLTLDETSKVMGLLDLRFEQLSFVLWLSFVKH